ncbi:MAG: metallophosphoesterase [Magnetococcales bacterium]|nr:metallophosphoesterase [Magnetococcales bacterium]
MKIGLISDSHDHVEHLQKALALFQERGVERIVHAGDIVSPAALLSLQGLPVHGVYGNNDGERNGLAKISACIGGELADEVLEMEIPAGRVAVYHGTVVAVLNALVRSQTYDLVITGHTHRVTDRWEGKTRVLNPGSAHGFNQGATVMVYDTITAQAEVVSL